MFGPIALAAVSWLIILASVKAAIRLDEGSA